MFSFIHILYEKKKKKKNERKKKKEQVDYINIISRE